MFGVFAHVNGKLVWLTNADDVESAKSLCNDFRVVTYAECLFVIPLAHFVDIDGACEDASSDDVGQPSE